MRTRERISELERMRQEEYKKKMELRKKQMEITNSLSRQKIWGEIK